LGAVALAGCGGGVPLLHPARTLDTGEVRLAGGISANVSAGGVSSSLSAARAEAASNPNVQNGTIPPGTDVTYAKGALVSAAIGPGIAPYVSARVGVGDRFEGGITYTARAARIDLRRSFDSGAWSYSIGAGGSFVLLGERADDLPNVDLNALHGYGADVPALAGWRSANELYQVWFGFRGGWEHENIDLVRTESRPGSLQPINLTGDRLYGGALVGLAVGFRHVHVALELDAAYQSIFGSYNGTSASVDGVTVSPASAVWWTF
jgi:hypothetical protein